MTMVSTGTLVAPACGRIRFTWRGVGSFVLPGVEQAVRRAPTRTRRRRERRFITGASGPGRSRYWLPSSQSARIEGRGSTLPKTLPRSWSYENCSYRAGYLHTELLQTAHGFLTVKRVRYSGAHRPWSQLSRLLR